MKYKIEIPEFYLLTIAVYGNMGDGNLPDIMRTWAQRECRKLGLDDKVAQLQNEHIRELGKKLRNTLGNDIVDKMENNITKAVRALESANLESYGKE